MDFNKPGLQSFSVPNLTLICLFSFSEVSGMEGYNKIEIILNASTKLYNTKFNSCLFSIFQGSLKLIYIN